MKNVELSSDNVEPPDWLPDLRDVASRVYEQIGRTAWDVSVLLCDEPTIAGLNQSYRKVSGPTDVLTFSQHEEGAGKGDADGAMPIAGDIVISLPTVAANAHDYGVSAREELLRVYVHALLHLAGYSHDGTDLSSPDAAEHPMLGLQERLVASLGKELDS
ncbi:MAG: rRNA maturation RNase YbeY [Spirochaetota bacterium]